MIGFLAATLRLLTGDVRAVDVAVNNASGQQLDGFDPSRPATATRTVVPASTVSATLLASNTTRRQFMVHNRSNATAFLSLSGAASPTTHEIVVARGGYYESILDGFTGAITVVLSAGTGDVDVVEITA